MGERIVDVLADPALGLTVLFKAHPATGTRLPQAAAARAAIEAELSAPAATHRVVGTAPDALYSAFNEADVLVADISSVVADFLASRKPYLVTNPRDTEPAAFHADFPSTAAGELSAPTSTGWPRRSGRRSARTASASVARSWPPTSSGSRWATRSPTSSGRSSGPSSALPRDCPLPERTTTMRKALPSLALLAGSILALMLAVLVVGASRELAGLFLALGVLGSVVAEVAGVARAHDRGGAAPAAGRRDVPRRPARRAPRRRRRQRP